MHAVLASLAVAAVTQAPHEWRGFRGPEGNGRAPKQGLPLTWDAATNIRWKSALPGPGASSPIVTGDAVFLTCWSGYGLDREAPGDPANLRRHLLRIALETGDVVWSREVGPAEIEDPYSGRLATHGYASSTPVTDGTRVYVFYGKRGVLAYDLDGEELWHTEVGQGSSEWNTGSGSSPLLVGDLVVVNAADEGDAIIAFDKRTGHERWRREAERLDLAFDSPVLVGEGDEQCIALALLEEIWGLHPRTGNLLWTLHTPTNGALAPTMVSGDGVLYSLGGQTGKRSIALLLGGEGDVTETHVLWSMDFGSYIPSPVFSEGHLYWVDEKGTAHCAVAATGALVYRERLDATFYASGVVVGDRIVYVSQADGAFVIAAKPEYELLAHNVIEGDPTRFDASPALVNGRLLLRSGGFLYCIGD